MPSTCRSTPSPPRPTNASRRARPGLRHRPQRGAGGLQGNALLSPRSLRSVAGPGEDRRSGASPRRPIHRRLRPGAGGACGRGRRRRPRRALSRQLQALGRRHAGSDSRPCCRTSCRPRSSSLSGCRPTTGSSSTASTTGCASRATSSTPQLTVADSFRIGCIGRSGPEEMRGALGGDRGHSSRTWGVGASGQPAAAA